MINKYIIAFILFFWAFVCEGQERFNNLYVSEEGGICQNVIVVDDGYIACIGTSVNGYRGFMLQKIDLEGNELWSKKYGYSGESWYEGWDNAFFETSDGGFALAGGHFPTEGYYYQRSYLMKFNSEGDSVWTMEYPIDSSFSGGMNGIQTSDGGYAICGFINYFTDSTMTDFYPNMGLLIKTDSLGNMQWYKLFGGSEYDSFNLIEQTLDGGYAMAGRSDSYSPSTDMYLVKADSIGNEQWHEIYGGGAYELEFRGLTIAQNGDIIAAGSKTTGSNPVTTNGVIIRIDYQETEKFNKEYQVYADVEYPYTDTSYALMHTVEELPDGNIVVICISRGNYSAGTRQRNLIFKLDSEGDSIWTKGISYPNYEFGTYHANLRLIKRTNDDGFIIAGWTDHDDSTPAQQVWLVKTDSLGNDGTWISEYKAPEISVELYPNPTNGIFYMISSTESKKAETLTYNIHNLFGELLTNGKLFNGEIAQVDISDHVSGMYIVSVSKNGQVVYSTKVIKQ